MNSLPPPSPSPSSLPPVVSPPQPSPVQRPPVRPPNKDTNAVLQNRPLILGLLFGVMAVLGLPLLWYSPVFSRKEKFWWSLAIVFYTLGLVLVAVAACVMAYNAWTQSQLAL